MEKLKLTLIDIDGVVYDFVTHMLSTHFSFLGKVEKDVVDYNMSKSLGIPKDHFWKTCDKADGIFCDGNLYDWTDSLIETCRKYSENVSFCTNPGNNPKHWSEKKKLFDKWFLNKNIGCIVTQQKEFLSFDGVVLIDDFEKNIEKFNKGDGIGILFPQYWNCNRSENLISDRVGYVDCTLDDICTVGFQKWKNIKLKNNN
jgi:hypothetical protein